MPVLVHLLVEKQSRGAVSALAAFGSEAKLAVPMLTKLLTHDDRWTRLAALKVLCGIPDCSKLTVIAMAEALNDEDLARRIDYPDLRFFGPLFDDVIWEAVKMGKLLYRTAIRFFADRRSGPNRSALVKALRSTYTSQKIASIGFEDIVTLAKAVIDGDQTRQTRAMQALNKVGLDFAIFLQNLVEELIDEDMLISVDAACTLAKIGEPGALALLNASNDSNSEVRRRVVGTLGYMASHSKLTVPTAVAGIALLAMCEDQDAGVAKEISRARADIANDEAKFKRGIKRPSLPKVNKREQLILRLRYGLETGQMWTLEKIGREFGLSQERIRQIEASALKRLQSDYDGVEKQYFYRIQGYSNGETCESNGRFESIEEAAVAAKQFARARGSGDTNESVSITILNDKQVVVLESKSINISDFQQMQGYCVYCRGKKEMRNTRAITMKNGKPAIQGVCPTCGTKMFRIIKS